MLALNITEHVCIQASKDAAELHLPVTGSEVVGLVPLKAMIDAADYYIEKENLFILEEDQKVHLAINRLGLATLSPFNAKYVC
jgi:glutamate formiminotransferase/formiminotetrahydrofolate cyclodeaminase